MRRADAARAWRAAPSCSARSSLFPFVFPAHWVLNIAIFVLMYAALATAWNLLGGFSGYLSLGHVAFFGIGAYANAILFEHIGSSPATGRSWCCRSIGIGVGVAVACRSAGWRSATRAATFAIVTLTLLFVVQQLAFNLHGLTGGSQGISMPLPPFSVATFERPFYFAMLALFALAMFMCWWVRGSKLGLMLFAIRDDEDRARGLGVRTTTVQARRLRRQRGPRWRWPAASGRTTSASSTRSSPSTR